MSETSGDKLTNGTGASEVYMDPNTGYLQIYTANKNAVGEKTVEIKAYLQDY